MQLDIKEVEKLLITRYKNVGCTLGSAINLVRDVAGFTTPPYTIIQALNNVGLQRKKRDFVLNNNTRNNQVHQAFKIADSVDTKDIFQQLTEAGF